MSDRTGYSIGVWLFYAALILPFVSVPGLWIYLGYNENRFHSAYNRIYIGQPRSEVDAIIAEHGLKVFDEDTSYTRAKIKTGFDTDHVLDIEYDSYGRVGLKEAFDNGVI